MQILRTITKNSLGEAEMRHLSLALQFLAWTNSMLLVFMNKERSLDEVL